MTHYTVLVRFEDNGLPIHDQISKMLEPYDEGKQVEEYKAYESEESIKRMAEHYSIDPNNLAELAKKMPDWSGGEGGVDDKGLFHMTRYNPLSKWDWWTLGGRWSGNILVLKKGTNGLTAVKGRPGVFKNPTGIDACNLKDIDFEAISRKHARFAKKSWADAIKETDALKRDFIYGIKDGETEKQYVERHSKSAFVTHAALDANGWHEAARMGWWAVEYDRSEDEREWEEKFKERFLSNPTDKTIIAIVDCHI